MSRRTVRIFRINIKEVKFMNLSLGKIELNGISFGMDTCMDEILGNSQFRSYVNGRVGIFTSEQVGVEGYTFTAEIIFIDKHINKIQLIPVNLEMEDPGYPDEKYQQEKKEGCKFFFKDKSR